MYVFLQAVANMQGLYTHWRGPTRTLRRTQMGMSLYANKKANRQDNSRPMRG